ncbi:cold shock and DUF1294 domain-containing protein [Geitlerinema sp. PCC 7407]|uniref:DUF1294 domain-containing protein n=1 Tax=Geitlerinema sp. PCC 7407 TaxID=1173025 RepID=UPI00029FA51D|nr:cold shock and DUF1294 domain-containing protein [Geitlerinema sp. PCC 7407]AFY67099.1 cold-shock DNA-binding domain protein [Geitlerinema sp. PCC 7407]
MKSGLRSGKLTKWNDGRGFGFIRPADGGEEVFLHISELKDATRRPRTDDTIYYYCVADSKGKIRASNAFILGARSKINTASTSSTNTARSSNALKLGSLILQTVLLSLIPVLAAAYYARTTGNAIPVLLYPGMSLATYVLYADDKSRAKRDDWRTSEKTLHICELAGGWIGGFLAQKILRHKSRKQSYQSVFWAIVVVHYFAWLFWLLVGKNL